MKVPKAQQTRGARAKRQPHSFNDHPLTYPPTPTIRSVAGHYTTPWLSLFVLLTGVWRMGSIYACILAFQVVAKLLDAVATSGAEMSVVAVILNVLLGSTKRGPEGCWSVA
jgi:hypothetical protein